MVLFEIDSYFIDAKPMQDSTDKLMIHAYHKLWQWIMASGKVKPKMHLLDNEALEAFKHEIAKNCQYQLVPPDTHCRNLAEQAIQTFKSHFIAILSGVDESFPMPLWDWLLPQAVLTLNLLRQANADPKISAYKFVHGKFEYNKMPLAPMGCAVQVHEHPQKQRTWAEHSVDGWYLQMSHEHYCCHVVFIKKTRSERVLDTVVFKHCYLTAPEVTPEDSLIQTLNNVKAAVTKHKNVHHKNALEQLTNLSKLWAPLNDKKV
jgi:hypothetical protein